MTGERSREQIAAICGLALFALLAFTAGQPCREAQDRRPSLHPDSVCTGMPANSANGLFLTGRMGV